MEFQLSYFKSWKMLWKCCMQSASKFGKHSHGHRTGKGQFSLQSRRKAMPKNAPTITIAFISAAAAKSLQSCPTLCNSIDAAHQAPPSLGFSRQEHWSELPAIASSNAWKWKVKVKSFSRVWLFVTPWTAAYQAPPLMGFLGKSTGVGRHCLLRLSH